MKSLKGLYMQGRKKLLLIGGSIALALGFGAALNAQTAPPREPAVATAEALPASRNTLKANDLKESFSQKTSPSPSTNRQAISYVEYSSYTQLYSLLPGARAIVQRYGVGTDDEIIASSGRFARITDDLYIYRNEDSYNCGTRGCQTVVFSTDADGFYPSSEIITAMAPPEYQINKNGEPSIFICTVDLEYIELKRINGEREMTPTTLDQGKECMRFMPKEEDLAPQPTQAPQP